MIIDSSVLVALLREEPETARFVPLLNSEYGRCKLSAANYLETAMVVDGANDEVLSQRLDLVIAHFAIEIVDVTRNQAMLARLAFRRFGKGRHPAALNFGDCFAYALSRASSLPLLFKGNDFAATDIKVASHPTF